MKEINPKPQDCSCIQGVVCEVKNCVYHDGGCYCQAEQIQVSPNYAISSSDTACSTFKNKTL